MNQLTKQIKVQDDTYEQLINIGNKNDKTFDDIIKKCVKAYEDKTDRKYEPRT
jgi:predicted CopG family antitoxin